MTMTKKSGIFFRRQFEQIKTGGPRVLCDKMKRAGSLMCLSVAAPFTVYFEMDWPKAYAFLTDRAVKKLKRLRMKNSRDKSQINKLLEKAIAYLGKSTDQIPDLSGLWEWMRNSLMLGNLYWFKNDMKQSIAVYQRTAEVRRQIIEKYQLDDLGMEFIPRVLPQGAIGVYEYFETYVKAGLLGLRSNKKMVLLLDPNASVTNPCYLKYWSKYVTIVSDPQAIKILAPLEEYLTMPMVTFMHLRDKVCISPFALGRVREQWIKEDRPPILTLSIQDNERGRSTLRSLGLSQDAWFVTLHVREAGWKDNGSSEDNFRNADITTYFSAIKLITDAGGWVVRIGDPTMSKLPAMPQVIDYAHSRAKSDWMDIFLCSQCRFMIGTSTGMCVVALSFGVPLVMTNLLPALAVYFFTSKDLFIPRLCFSKDKENYLSFNEWISPPVATVCTQTHFDDLNVRVVVNTAEEIKDLVEEMLERCMGTIKYTEEEEMLQKKFREMTADCGKQYGDSNLVANARIGRKFLRDHAERN